MKVATSLVAVVVVLSGATAPASVATCRTYAKGPDIVSAERCYTDLLRSRPTKALLPEAISVYKRALKTKGAVADRVYNLALALFRNGQPEESLAFLDAHGSDAAEFHALSGAVLRTLGQQQRAVDELRAAATKDGANEDYAHDLIVVLLQNGLEATRDLNSALQRFPASAKLHAVAGMAAYANGRNAEAVTYYEQAVRLDPNAADFRAALGDVYVATGSFDKASAAYDAAIRIEPCNAEYETKAGKNHLRLQRHAQAVAAFRKAVACDGAAAEANFQLGKLAFAAGEDSRAVLHLEKSAASPGAPAEAFYQLSLAYRRLGRAELSRAALERFQQLKAQ